MILLTCFYITKGSRLEAAGIRCLLSGGFKLLPLTRDLGPPSSNLLLIIFLAFPRASYLEPLTFFS
jgi:hypothetical protein